MITVLEGIKLSTEFFEKKGIESPRVNAEILLAHILKCKRLELYLAFDKPLKEEELSQYRELLKRRAKYEPLQYIVGTVEFYGLNFRVDPSVLIPRPETEILIETVLNVVTKENALNVLDIGTGTGNIPVALAMHLPEAAFTTIDISDEAIELAKQNAELNGVPDRIAFIKCDILSDNNISPVRFDVVVSNPPYVDLQEYNRLQPEILQFEPRQAVTDDSDGLTFYRTISAKAKSLLKAGGMLFFEIGKGQSEQVKEIMSINGFTDITIRKDYLNIDRVIYGVIN